MIKRSKLHSIRKNHDDRREGKAVDAAINEGKAVIEAKVAHKAKVNKTEADKAQAKTNLATANQACPINDVSCGKKHSLVRRLVLFSLAFVALCGAGLVTCALLAIYWAAPSLEKFHMRSNVLYAQDGQLVYEMLSPDEYHRILTLPEQVDPLYIKMLLASEDERFYEHHGVDPLAIARALVSNIAAGQRVSGASTLAMQVCRLLEPKERNLLNKIKEALGAMYLTHKYGREQVLIMYLTLAPFGGNIEGVTAASYSYFAHSPRHLTPAEAALLVALPRSPEKIRPDRHHRAALYYRNEVLTKAVTDGVIKQDILDSATKEGVPQFTWDIPKQAFHLGQSLFAGKLHPLLAQLVREEQAYATPMDKDCPAFGYLQDTVPTLTTGKADHEVSVTSEGNKNKLASIDSSALTSPTQMAKTAQMTQESKAALLDSTHVEMPLSLKLRFDLQGRRLPTEIYTTLDVKVQETLLEVMHGYQRSGLNHLTQESMGIIALDNQSFEVIGYVSSDNSFVDVIQAQRSPGSALKPFAYALAFEQGLMHPNSVLLDLGKIYRTYQPRNYDRMFFGEITAAQALQGSLNLPALEVMRAIGPVNFVDHLNSFPNTITNRYLLKPQYERMQSEEKFKQEAAQEGSNKIQNLNQDHPLNSTRTTVLSEKSEGDSLKASPLLPQGVHPDQEQSSFNNLASAAMQHPSSFNPNNYIRGRIKLMPHTTPHIGVILGACSISLFDLTQLYASLAHDGQIKPLELLSKQQTYEKTLSPRNALEQRYELGQSDALAQRKGHMQSSDEAKSSDMAQSNVLAKNTDLFDADSSDLNSDNQWATFLDKDTARATFNILEGLPHPAGFNYDPELKISYKTGTSFKYRDTVALGTRGAITVGVWQGRTDGNPSKLTLSAYEKTAPILFRVLTLLPERKVLKPLLPQTGVLKRKPPQALAQLEIKTLGLTGLRRTNELEQQRGFTQGVPLEIVYPSDGMKIRASTSGRILLQIQGGHPPYYVLLDGQVHSENSFFEPTHNGVYTITVIDSKGQSQEVQILVEGVQAMPTQGEHTEQSSDSKESATLD